MKKLLLIFHTIIHLRFTQIRYQLGYRLRSQWRKITGFNYPLSIKREGIPVMLQNWIEKPVSFIEDTFTFLNLSKKYKARNINWNETQHGKLWTYNLNYMDYLLQTGMDKATGLQLINHFIEWLPYNPTSLEPYPIAIRGTNWIKFISKFRFYEENIGTQKNLIWVDESLYAQYQILFDKLEYHLLANHLLEDGFSLLFGAFYFNDSTFYNKAKQIVITELAEQILDDGAHFELSPMYHQIILDRLLDSINLLQNNQRFDDQQLLLEVMQKKAESMLNWINTITFSNGQIPLLNDAAPGIAPTTEQINSYAVSLKLKLATYDLRGSQSLWKTRNPILGASGYRKFNSPSYECIIDIGPIGPAYQPGHAHADTFNLVVNVNDEPVLIDTGISTYDAGEIRLKERGTAAHNTVTVQDQNSSEIWSSFRVARRAKVMILKDDQEMVVAQHHGYSRLGTTHKRAWCFFDEKIEIADTLTGKISEGKAHFWLSPQLNPKRSGQTIEAVNTKISFEGADDVILMSEQIPIGYNKLSTNYKIEILFKNHLKTTIICS